MSHFHEDELIAYHLGESNNAPAVEKHLAACEACSELSDSIGHTLRIFSADRVSTPEFEPNWNRVRSQLTVLPRKQKRRLRYWLFAPSAACAIAAVLVLFFSVRWFNHRDANKTHYAFNRPGPLTMEPVDEVNHLDAAERLLTVVNHTDGELAPGAREEARQLQLRNADFVQRAQQRGDYAEATTLEDLGRVLTNIEHQPSNRRAGIDLRIEMNTDGLLLNLRILRQNDQNN